MQPSEPSILNMLPFLGLFFVMMYFTSIRPQRKQQQHQQKLLENVQINDTVKLQTGILGRLKAREGEYLLIETAKDSQLWVHHDALAAILPQGSLPKHPASPSHDA